ncbi:unnamed protein product [Penicillium viridicatum]
MAPDFLPINAPAGQPETVSRSASEDADKEPQALVAEIQASPGGTDDSSEAMTDEDDDGDGDDEAESSGKEPEDEESRYNGGLRGKIRFKNQSDYHYTTEPIRLKNCLIFVLY